MTGSDSIFGMPGSQNTFYKSPEENGKVPAKGKGIFYGWWLVGVGVFLLTLMSLCVFRGMGVMMVVLQKEFAWTRTQISLGTLFSRVEGAALGPVEGFLIDKIGARRMVLVGFSIMSIGFVLFSFIQNIWQFYGVFIIITLGSGIGGWLAVMSVLNSWFNRKRSIAMAGAMSYTKSKICSGFAHVCDTITRFDMAGTDSHTAGIWVKCVGFHTQS